MVSKLWIIWKQTVDALLADSASVIQDFRSATSNQTSSTQSLGVDTSVDDNFLVRSMFIYHLFGYLWTGTMRADIIGHFQPCMNEIYLHIDARMADYIRAHPYICSADRRLIINCLIVCQMASSR